MNNIIFVITANIIIAGPDSSTASTLLNSSSIFKPKKLNISRLTLKPHHLMVLITTDRACVPSGPFC